MKKHTSLWIFSLAIAIISGIISLRPIFISAESLISHPVRSASVTANTWMRSNFGLTPKGQVAALAVSPSNENIAYAGNSEGVYKSTDGGATWTKTSGTIAEYIGRVLTVNPADASIIYAANRGGVLRSTDGGSNWIFINNGLPDGEINVASIVVSAVNPNVLFLALLEGLSAGGVETVSGGVFKSTNGGASWSPINNGLPPRPTRPDKLSIEGLAISASDPNVLYATPTCAGVYKTTDGGGTWRPVNSGLPPSMSRCGASIVISPVDPNTVFANVSGSENGVDVGGIYKTINGGDSWVRANTGLSGDIGYRGELVIDPVNPSVMYVSRASQGEGVFKSIDGGTNWTAFNDGLLLENNTVLSLAISRSGKQLYAGMSRQTTPTVQGGGDIFFFKYENDPCLLSCSASGVSAVPVGTPTDFTASAQLSGCSGVITYEWDFGDTTSTSSQQNPQHIYARAGSYTWKVTARGPSATVCTKTGTITVANYATDVSVNMTAAPAPVVPGAELTYQIFVTNNGDIAANNVTVTDVLPVEMTYISCAATAGGVCGGTDNRRTITFSSLAMQAQSTITLIARINKTVSSGNKISNTVTVSATSSDTVPANNAQTVEVLALNPLIFVPGIAGSKIDIDGDNIWLGRARTNHRRLTLDPNDPDSKKVAVVPDVLRRDVVAGSITDTYKTLLERLSDSNLGKYREYRVEGNPSRRTAGSCDINGQKKDAPTLFVFAYDWRKSNEIAADQLADYIGCVRKFYGDDVKIDVIAHSMGGLATRRYITKYPNSHGISKLITLGSPWLGTPKAIAALQSGLFLDQFLSSVLILDSTVKSLVEFFPGMHQLLPSQAYFDLGGKPYIYQGKPYTYGDFQKRFDEMDFKTSKPISAGKELHDKPGQDDWRNDNSGVQYFHLYGIRKNPNTVVNVRESRITICRLFVCQTFQFLTPTFGEGDGTVSTLSLTRKGQGLNYNAREVRENESTRLIAFRATDDPCAADTNDNGDEDACKDKYVGHTELTANLKAFCTALMILGVPTPSACANQLIQFQEQKSLSQPQGKEANEPSAYYLRTLGISTISIVDSAGRRTNPLASPPDGGIKGVTPYMVNENMATVILSAQETYTVQFRMPEQPVWLEVLKGTDLAPTQTIRYQDLDLPAGAMAAFRITPQGAEPLKYDRDGNGTYETEVSSTVNLTGAAALDQTPPIVNITPTFQRGNAVVAIAAEDIGTGVSAIRYSLDGTHFNVYTAPFSVSVLQTPKIYVFADDKAANRASLVTYSLSTAATSVSAASFNTNHLAPESIAAAFGDNLATSTQSIGTIPLPTTLAGTTVTVRDNAGAERFAPLFYISPTQVNYQIPAGTAAGAATVIINNGSRAVAVSDIQVTAAAPSLFAANANGQGVGAATALRIRAGGSQVYEAVSRYDTTLKQFVPVPIDLGPAGPAEDKVFLVLFGTGLRGAGDPNHDGNVNESVRVSIAGNAVIPVFAGNQGTFVGLDQINVEIPRSLIGKGDVGVSVTAGNKISNSLTFNIK